MGISENFLVNTKSFDPIIEALISLSEQPDTISDTTLEKMGYDNPSDLLVLHVLRGLDIINQDKTPSDLYFKMVDSNLTKEAIAEGVINGYDDLFHQNYEVHKMLPGELQEELKEYFEGKKTDLIIKYIANTFHKLVSYAGIQNVEEARDRMLGEKRENEKEFSAAEDTISEAGNNSKTTPDYKGAADQDEIKSRSIEEILFGDKSSESESEPVSDENLPQEASSQSAESELDSEPEQETDVESDFEVEIEDGDVVELESDPEPVPEHEPEYEPFKAEPSSQDEQELEDNPDKSPLSNFNISDKRVQKAVVKQAELQYKLGHYEDALESSKEIIAYFDETEEEFLKNAVSNAIIRRVELVKKLGQDHKLLPSLNEVIRRFANADKPEFYDQASKAMLQKAELLESRDYEKKDLIPLYNKIIGRLEDETDPYVQEEVNEIFIRRLKLLNRADDKSELLKALDQSIKRFEGSERFRKYLEETMFRKAEVLESMNRHEEALDAYTAFLEEFGQAINS